MAERVEPRPGPDKKDSRQAVLETIAAADEPCLSVGMVADRVEFSRQTCHTRLRELEAEGRLASTTIGGSNAYWITEPEAKTDGGFWYQGIRAFRVLQKFARGRL